MKNLSENLKEENINILFITHYTGLYGANKSLLNLLEGIKNHDIKPLVVVPAYGDICEVLTKENISFIIQEFEWWCGVMPKLPTQKIKRLKVKFEYYKLNQRRKKNNLDNLILLNHKLVDFEPDFIHSNSSVFNFGLLYGKKYHIPHIWHLRESQEQYYLKWFYNLNYVNKSINSSEIIISVSNFLKENYHRKNKIRNIKVIYNGVLAYKALLKLDQLRKAKPINKNEALVYGIVGLLHPKKGHEDAIRAFSKVNERFPKTKLLIVGEGDQSRLQNLVNDLGITKNIEFWGHVSDPFQAFLKMDVCLMCSRMEGLGRVTIEAMASNIPVIGYKEGGTIEIIQEKITGLFYEKDYNQLSEKMIYLLENKDQRIKMGNKGRELFELKYTSEIYAKNFMEILENYKNTYLSIV